MSLLLFVQYFLFIVLGFIILAASLEPTWAEHSARERVKNNNTKKQHIKVIKVPYHALFWLDRKAH